MGDTKRRERQRLKHTVTGSDKLAQNPLEICVDICLCDTNTSAYTILHNTFFSSLFISLCAGQCEHTISLQKRYVYTEHFSARYSDRFKRVECIAMVMFTHDIKKRFV